eukprot:5996120-Pyramimonas_sp.AAC.1
MRKDQNVSNRRTPPAVYSSSKRVSRLVVYLVLQRGSTSLCASTTLTSGIAVVLRSTERQQTQQIKEECAKLGAHVPEMRQTKQMAHHICAGARREVCKGSAEEWNFSS